MFIYIYVILEYIDRIWESPNDRKLDETGHVFGLAHIQDSRAPSNHFIPALPLGHTPKLRPVSLNEDAATRSS